MIVRILSHGRSFKGLAAYLTHDPDAETDARVGWTHTHNLANNNVASAVDEMLWTAHDAELLKMEAGIRAGGRGTENPVKHISLNWAPGEEPTRDHMIETAGDFLRHMKWQEHQALFVAHEDKDYRHLHVMLNAVHPETGLKLDDNFEYRRAQAWAADYEREHGLHCENRLKDEREREEAPTRPAWMAFREKQKEFEENEKSRMSQNPNFEITPENPGDISAKEWASLKILQRDEREGFFAEGKLAFKEMRSGIFREVRDEFRERWADYYDCEKLGVDGETLKSMKAELVAEQKTVLEERRDEACMALRDQRTAFYQELLAGQREMRLGLRERQAVGLESLDLIEDFRVDRSRYTTMESPVDERRPEAQDVTPARDAEPRDAWAIALTKHDGRGEMRSGGAIAGDIADGMVTFAGSILDILVGGDPAQAERNRAAPKSTGPDLIAIAADDAAMRGAREAEIEEQRKRADQWSRSQQ